MSLAYPMIFMHAHKHVHNITKKNNGSVNVLKCRHNRLHATTRIAIVVIITPARSLGYP